MKQLKPVAEDWWLSVSRRALPVRLTPAIPGVRTVRFFAQTPKAPFGYRHSYLADEAWTIPGPVRRVPLLFTEKMNLSQLP